jgi:hypothetical protein
MHGSLVTHSEAISIAADLTLGDPAAPTYRPTVHYAYHPCDDALLSPHELAGRNWRPQGRQCLLRDDISGGIDELGALLMRPMRHAPGSPPAALTLHLSTEAAMLVSFPAMSSTLPTAWTSTPWSSSATTRDGACRASTRSACGRIEALRPQQGRRPAW